MRSSRWRRINTPEAELTFDYSNWGSIAESLKLLVGRFGTAVVDHLCLKGDEVEDYLLMAAITDDGFELTDEQVHRLFDLPASVVNTTAVEVLPAVTAIAARKAAATLRAISEKQAQWFDDEMDKLDRWAEDKRAALRADLRERDEDLKTLKREARQAATLPEKLTIQRKIKKTEARREEAWRTYDTDARSVEQAKETIIDGVEARLASTHAIQRILTIRFTMT